MNSVYMYITSMQHMDDLSIIMTLSGIFFTFWEMGNSQFNLVSNLTILLTWQFEIHNTMYGGGQSSQYFDAEN